MLIITQVCHRLATIKGHSKMSSFTVLGGPGGSKTSQYLVWPPFASRSATNLLCIELIRLLIVACGMLVHSSSIAVCEVAGYRQELEHAVVYVDPEHPKHALWVTCPVSILAMQELGWFQLPGIVYRSLQHRAVHRAVHYHAATRCLPSALYSDLTSQWNTSPKCQTPSNVSICPLKSVTTTNCSQVKTPMRTTSMQMSFPDMVSDSLCRHSLVMQTDCCSSCPGGWCQMILEVKMLDVDVLGWHGPVTHGLRLWGRLDVLPNDLKCLWREINIQFTGNSSGGHSCRQNANCTLPQNLCDKTAHFRVAFYCGRPKAHLCNNHAI